MAAGGVNADQARVIVRSLDRLPTTGDFAVTPEQRVTAEKHLVGLAADYDAKALARLGMHLFEVIAPELADQFEGKVLADQEAAALKRTWLTMRHDDEGTVHGRFRIPALHGDILSKAILALASPARPDPHGPDGALAPVAPVALTALTAPTALRLPSRPPRVSRSPPRSSTASRSVSSSKHCPPTGCPPRAG